MATNKELFLKGTKNLFYIHIATLIVSVFIELPLLDSLFGWISIILTIGIAFQLFQIASVNDRYRKAALCMAIVSATAVITKFFNIGILALAASICSLIAVYQEYKGHSEMMMYIDHKLADKWRGLFYWQVFGGFLLGILSTPIIILLGVVIVFDANLLAGILVIIILCFDIIMEILYLRYMKRMHEIYKHYEPVIDGYREYI